MELLLPPDRETDIPLPRNPHKPKWEDFEFYTKPAHKPAQNRNPVFEGWDTETISGNCLNCRHGYHGKACLSQVGMKLCGCTQYKQQYKNAGKPFLIASSGDYKEISSKEDMYSVLHMMRDEGQGRINVFWNIDYDVRTLLNWDKELQEKLYPEGGAIGTVEDWNGFDEITYLKKKMLTIRRNKRKTCFYDAYLFYQQSLGNAAARYLGQEAPKMKAKRGEDLYGEYLDNPKEVIDYCIWDANSARLLMERIFVKFRAMDFYPSKPISAGYVAEDYLRTHTNLPHVFDVPPYINEAAWEAFRGGWIDIYKRGTMEVWKYDINSAYPWAMKDLPDLRQGEWVKEIVHESLIGFVLVRMLQDLDSMPAIASWMKIVHGYPSFDRPVQCWITLAEYQALSKCPGIQMEVLNCFCFIPKANADMPMRKPVIEMGKFKNQSHPKRGREPDEALYLASKQIFNSFYGKFVQRTLVKGKYKAGKIFNAVYGATITGRSRALIIDVIRNDLSSVVSISTDCVTSTKKLQVPEDDTELGYWKVECEGETGTFVFPGIYEIGGHTTHSRGFRISSCVCGHDSKQHINNKACSYCSCPSGFKPSLVRLMERSEGASLVINYERPWGVREAYRASDLDLVGLFEKRVYEKGIETIRRLWLQEPASFKDLLNKKFASIPLPVTATIGGKKR